MEIKAKIFEVFSSIQGEGPYTGVKQIFIRFAGCNLKCVFCDEGGDKYGHTRTYDPLSLKKEVEKLSGMPKAFHSLSLTGGEPLLQAAFLKQFLPAINRFRIYLETNGTLPEAFKEISSWIDFVSLDFKLPSSSGQRAYWKEHSYFLELAKEKHIFVKIVITSDTTSGDVKESVEIINRVDENITLILQPVSSTHKFKRLVRGERLLYFQGLALKRLKTVKIMPQFHKIAGVR